MDGNNIINDPNYVPLADHAGVCLMTHDERILIVSSSLDTRFTDATADDNKFWLKTPPRQVRSHR